MDSRTRYHPLSQTGCARHPGYGCAVAAPWPQATGQTRTTGRFWHQPVWKPAVPRPACHARHDRGIIPAAAPTIKLPIKENTIKGIFIVVDKGNVAKNISEEFNVEIDVLVTINVIDGKVVIDN